MGAAEQEDVVQIQNGKKPGEPHILTINCPDKTGLGCDLCGIILEFGLSITRGDITNDGKWCYIVFWILPQSLLTPIRWGNLKRRLLYVCPPCTSSFYLDPPPSRPVSPVYRLKFCCSDRRGLLHELAIQRIKVSTTPDGRIVDLFFITDSM